MLVSPPGKADGLKGRLAKATYVGSHLEYRVETDIGEIFAIAEDDGNPFIQGDDVSVTFAEKGPVLLPA